MGRDVIGVATGLISAGARAARAATALLLCVAVSSRVSAQAIVPTLTFDSVLKVTGTADSARAFTRLVDVARGPDGTLYAADAGNGRIHMFSGAGASIGAVGGAGMAPGLFTLLGSVGFVHDTLYAKDSRTGVITYFNRSGTSIGQLAVNVAVNMERLTGASPTQLLPDGTAIMSAGAVMSLAGLPPMPVLHSKRTGELIGTLAMLDMTSATLNIARDGGGQMFVNNPFPVVMLSAIDGRAMRIAVITPAELAGLKPGQYRVSALSFKGDTLWSRVYDTTPTVSSKQSTDSVISAMGKAMNGHISESELRLNIRVPEWKPAVDRALYASDGSLWVKTAVRSGDLAEWNTIDRNGAVTARILLPARFDPSEINGDELIGIEKSAAGSAIAVYRIHRPAM